MKLISNFKNTNKLYLNTLFKAIGVGFLLSVMLISFVGITGAWFTLTQQINTTKNIGKVSVSVSNINNPFTYLGNPTTSVPVSITNLSNVHVALRCFINIAWQNDDPLDTVNVVLSSADWTVGQDGYYYYNNVLKPSGEAGDSTNFLNEIEFVDADASQIGNTFEIRVYSEVAQTANDGYKILFSSAPTEWLNNLS